MDGNSLLSTAKLQKLIGSLIMVYITGQFYHQGHVTRLRFLLNNWVMSLRICHFTVLCSVTRPLNESEAAVEFALIQTLLLFLCKSCCCNVNVFLFTKEKQ